MTFITRFRWIYQNKMVLNAILFNVCAAFTVGLIQHAMFFYSFPPDPDRYVHVNWMAYIVLTILLFISIKLGHYLAESSQLVEEVD